MIWEVVSTDDSHVTERAPYAGGHLVRMAWRHGRFAADPLDGSGVVYVPEPIPAPVVSAEPLEADDAQSEVETDDAAVEVGADSEAG
jgi:hypothetical protein